MKNKMLISSLTLFALIGMGSSSCHDFKTINGCELHPATTCRNVDLSNQDISGTDLRDSDFTGSKFVNANVSHSVFVDAILDHADFRDANTTDATFAGAKSCKHITWTDKAGNTKSWADGTMKGGPCYLKPALQIRKATGCTIDKLGTDSDCQSKTYSYAEISSLKIPRDLSRSNFSRTTFQFTNLQYSILKDSTLVDADFTSANLEDTDLTNADLTNTNLKGANLQNAILTNTQFINANLDKANLTGATVTGTYFTNASCKNIIWIDGRSLTDGALAGGPCAAPSSNSGGGKGGANTGNGGPNKTLCPIEENVTQCSDIFPLAKRNLKDMNVIYKKLSLVCHVDKQENAKISAFLNCCNMYYKDLLQNNKVTGKCKW